MDVKKVCDLYREHEKEVRGMTKEGKSATGMAIALTICDYLMQSRHEEENGCEIEKIRCISPDVYMGLREIRCRKLTEIKGWRKSRKEKARFGYELLLNGEPRRLVGVEDGEKFVQRLGNLMSLVNLPFPRVSEDEGDGEEEKGKCGVQKSAMQMEKVSVQDVFPEKEVLGKILKDLGCEYLNQISGWRKVYSQKFGRGYRFALRINTRYAQLPEEVKLGDIWRLEAIMRHHLMELREEETVDLDSHQNK